MFKWKFISENEEKFCHILPLKIHQTLWLRQRTYSLFTHMHWKKLSFWCTGVKIQSSISSTHKQNQQKNKLTISGSNNMQSATNIFLKHKRSSFLYVTSKPTRKSVYSTSLSPGFCMEFFHYWSATSMNVRT